MSEQIGVLDLAIIAAYLLGIVAIGCYAGLKRRRGERSKSLFSGRPLPALAVDRHGLVCHEHLLACTW